MILTVFPLIKLPRRFHVFDYSCQESSHYQPGDVFEISFRHRKLLGIARTQEQMTEERRLLEITSKPIFHISPNHLAYLESLAKELGQSPSSICSVAFEGLSAQDVPYQQEGALAESPKISRAIIADVKEILSQVEEKASNSIAIDDETSVTLMHALLKQSKKQMIVLVPRERDADLVARFLRSFKPAILTGRTLSRQRNAVIRSWHKGEIRVLVGTRQSVLIEPNDLGVIFIYNAGCDDHRSDRRNPHIDARHAAQLLARQYNATLFVADHLPPITEKLIVPSATTSDISLIDVSHRSESSGTGLVTQSLIEEIKLALHSQKKVLLCLNRKGVAKRLECKDCGHVPFCGTCGSLPVIRSDDLLCEACGTEMWKPEVCPACGSKHISHRTIGSTRIEDGIRKVFPEANIQRIEKGQSPEVKADIVIATEYFWSSVIVPFRTYGFGLVAELLADMSFIPGDFRGAEVTARKLRRLERFAKHEQATCLVQTLTRDRIQSLLGPAYVNEKEYEVRKKYSLPPCGILVTFERANLEDLPEEIREKTILRNGVLTAKIDMQTFHHWQTLFPILSDQINIRIMF